MLTEQQANLLLHALAPAEGETLNFKENGDCTMISAEQNLIYLRYDSDLQQIHFCGVVGTLPEDEEASAKILKRFMSANFMWHDSMGSTFAVEEENDFLMLQKSYQDSNATDTAFRTAINNFNLELSFWMEHFEDAPEEEEINLYFNNNLLRV